MLGVSIIGMTLTLSLAALMSLGLMTALHLLPHAPAYMGAYVYGMEPVGVVVHYIDAESPADAAGLQLGDVIYTVNGRYIDSETLIALLEQYRPNQTVTLGIQRDGDMHTVPLTFAYHERVTADDVVALPMDADCATYPMMHGVHYDGEAWTIDNLPDDSPLLAHGLSAGDVVLQVNNITPTADALEPLTTYMMFSDDARLTVLRDGDAHEMQVSAQVVELMLVSAIHQQ